MEILKTPGFLHSDIAFKIKYVCERLASHARARCVFRSISVHDQTPGFSTVFTNLLSSMPEAEYLLHARAAEQEMNRGPESTVVFETEMVSPPPRHVCPLASRPSGGHCF